MLSDKASCTRPASRYVSIEVATKGNQIWEFLGRRLEVVLGTGSCSSFTPTRYGIPLALPTFKSLPRAKAELVRHRIEAAPIARA